MFSESNQRNSVLYVRVPFAEMLPAVLIRRRIASRIKSPARRHVSFALLLFALVIAKLTLTLADVEVVEIPPSLDEYEYKDLPEYDEKPESLVDSFLDETFELEDCVQPLQVGDH